MIAVVALGLTGIALVACHPLPPPDPVRSRPDCFFEWNPGCPRVLDDRRPLVDCRWPGEPVRTDAIDTRPECKIASFEGGVMQFDGGILGTK